ncbi:MAG TPA: TadE family protein [Segeticoccus sp.]|nr:TadE family protein [Segeticoccus sp.]
MADFALVAGLLCVLFLAALQLGIALHIRNTLIASAAEGARYGARVHSTPADGAARARTLIGSSLSERYARNVTAAREVSGGVAVVEVRATAPLPLLGPFGPQGAMSVSAQAFSEVQ